MATSLPHEPPSFLFQRDLQPLTQVTVHWGKENTLSFWGIIAIYQDKNTTVVHWAEQGLSKISTEIESWPTFISQYNHLEFRPISLVTEYIVGIHIFNNSLNFTVAP